MRDSDLLLRTIHGSRLYGLAHSGSDYDYYCVVFGKDRKASTQKIVGSEDTLTITLDRFLRLCVKGVPQALEAMFSPLADVDSIPFIRGSFNAYSYEVLHTYERTIKNFWATGEFKRQRHALRLYLNREEIIRRGAFNPTLSNTQAEVISSLAETTVDLGTAIERLHTCLSIQK